MHAELENAVVVLVDPCLLASQERTSARAVVRFARIITQSASSSRARVQSDFGGGDYEDGGEGNDEREVVDEGVRKYGVEEENDFRCMKPALFQRWKVRYNVVANPVPLQASNRKQVQENFSLCVRAAPKHLENA